MGGGRGGRGEGEGEGGGGHRVGGEKVVEVGEGIVGGEM